MTLPDTPAGKSLTRLLDRLSTRQPYTTAEAAEAFNQQFLDSVGGAEVVAPILDGFAERNVPFEVAPSGEAPNPTTIVAEITNAHGVSVLVTCSVEESEPHLISVMQLRPKPRDISSLDEVDDLLAAHGAVGLSAALIVDGKIEWARGWGVTNSEDPAPITADTILQCGSISKPVAAIGALRLVDESVIDLDIDVNEMLTSWKLPDTNGWQPKVSVRDLLTHTAGLTIWGFQGYGPDDRVATLVEVLDGSGNTPAIRSEALPRVTWRYSGGGFTVLQQLMIDVTGKTFPELMQDLVLGPLEMNDSTYEQPIPERLKPRTASGHSAVKPIPGRWNLHPEMAAAGLWTTASDLARFALGVQTAIAGRPGALLSRRMGVELLEGCDVQKGMGLGVFRSGSDDRPTFAHGGANSGFQAGLTCAEDGSFGIAALSNSNEGGAAVADLFRFLAADAGVSDAVKSNPFSQEALMAMGRAVPIEHREPAAVTPEEVQALVGDYTLQSGRLVSFRVGEEGGAVVVDGQNPLPVYPFSAKEWVSKAIDVRIEIEAGVLKINQLGQTVEAKRAS